MTTITFWSLVVLPGLLPGLILYIYFLRFTQRKHMITTLLNRSSVVGRTRRCQRITDLHREEWKSRLDLDLPSYVYPTALAGFLSMTGSLVLIAQHDSANDLHLPSSLLTFVRLASPAAVAGFAGAYVWGLYDLVDRFRILNLPISVMHSLWFRLLLGPILGAYAQSILADGVGGVVTFGLMGIPIASLTKWVQDLAAQRLAFSQQDRPAQPMWELVQGLTTDIISRLTEAGVPNISHLANQDPINLLRRTNIEWRNILDMMDQAYLASYVGAGIDKLRPKGIRGAIEMAILWPRLNSIENSTRSNAESLLRDIAADVNTDEQSVRNLVINLWEDPQVNLIWSMWFDREASEPSPSDQEVNAEQVRSDPRSEPALHDNPNTVAVPV